MKNPQLFFVAASLCATSAFASDPAPISSPLEIMVVTGARIPQRLNQTITDTAVISEQDIIDSQAVDVPTLLRTLAGVEVVQSGGLGKVSSIFTRGTNSSHVLVLLDGVRINSATTGTTALEHIMLDSIERIEVVRGNVSSLYGSEAIGGVIQLFTKRGRGAPAFNASAGLGSHSEQRLAAGFSGSVEATSYSVNIGKIKADGVSAINTSIAPTANPDKDGYDNTTLNAQIQYVINADHQWSVSLFGTRGDSSYDQSGTWNNLPSYQHNTLANIGKVSVALDNRLTYAWQSHVRLAQSLDDARDYKNAVQQSRLRTTNDQFVWQNGLTVADTHKLNLSLEYFGQAISVQDIDTANPYTKTRRTVNSFLGGYVGEFGAQQVQFNLRQDRYSDFGTANTGLLGYGLSFADNWRATASVSNAFRAPTFNDLYRPGWDGNPNLKPERANNHEVGLHYASGEQRIDLIYFDNRIHNLIAYQSPSMMNINQARIDGVELSYGGGFGDTHLKVDVTLQNPRDTKTGLALLRRAKSYGNVGVTQKIGAWRVGGDMQFSGARADSDINTFARTTLDGYTVVNLTASHALDKKVNLSLRVDNLFQKDYMVAHGYNTLGRSFFVGINYQP